MINVPFSFLKDRFNFATHRLRLISLLFALLLSSSNGFSQLMGNILSLDGNDDYINTHFDQNLSTWTLELWVKGSAAPDNSGTTYIIDRGSNFQLTWNHTEVLRQGAVSYSDGSTTLTATFGPLVGNEWYHLAATYDGTAITTYKNGEFVTTTNYAINPESSADIMTIGASVGETKSGFFSGDLDEIRIWQGARTQQEIRNNMHLTLNGDETGLQVYYQLEETSGTTTDNFGGTDTYDGTLNGTTFADASESSPAFYGTRNALVFDGDNDYITTGFSTDLNTFTVECWIKGTSTPVNTTTTQVIDRGSNFQLTWDHTTEGQKGAIVYNNGSPVVASFGTLEAGQWYFLSATYDGTDLKAYKNGVLITTTNNTDGPTTSTDAMIIGSDLSQSQFFAGVLDEVRIWEGARTQAEIKNYMHKGLYGTETNLKVYYKLDESSGSTADNEKGVGSFDGTMNNFDFTSAIPSPAFAGPKNSLNFDGTDDFVIGGSGSELLLRNGNNITIEAWIKADAFGESEPEHFIVTRYNNLDSDYALSCSGEGVLNFKLEGTTLSSPQNTLSANTWHHVAASYDGTTQKIVVDGVQIVNSNATIPINESLITSILYLGHHDGSTADNGYFAGQMDEVRIWETSRTIDEIRENMFGSLTGDEEGLVVYYNFDHYEETELHDFTADGSYGTLNNMADDDWVTSTAFNTWLTTSSTTWSNAQNWSRNSVPSSQESVAILASDQGNEPVIGSTPTLQNLYIGEGVGTSVSDYITINGNAIISSNLSFPANVQPSTIGGDLVISDMAAITLQAGSKMTINGNLSNAGSITLQSPPDNGPAGSLITNGGVENTGSFTMERWISQGSLDESDYTWHGMGLPIGSSPAGDNFSGDYIYSYTEADNSWSNVSDGATSMDAEKGYIVKTVNGAKTLTFTGTPNSGTLSSDYTNSNPGGTDNGYHLVSNPYPSGIDLELIDRTNLGNTFWVWDPVTENYLNYQVGTGGTLEQNLNPSQAFFIKVVDGQATGTLAFDNADRVHIASGNTFKSAETEIERLRIKVSGNSYYDELFINRKDLPNNGYKLFSMNPEVPQIYAQNNERDFAIFNFEYLDEQKTIPIGFKSAAKGWFEIELVTQSFKESTVVLRDMLLGTETILDKESTYQFEHDPGNEENRFEVVLKSDVTTEIEDLEPSEISIFATRENILILSDETIKGFVEVMDVNGKLLTRRKMETNQLTLPAPPPGLYIVTVSTEEKSITRKIIIQ